MTERPTYILKTQYTFLLFNKLYASKNLLRPVRCTKRLNLITGTKIVKE